MRVTISKSVTYRKRMLHKKLTKFLPFGLISEFLTLSDHFYVITLCNIFLKIFFIWFKMHWKSVMLEKVWLSYAHDKTHTDEGWVPHIHTYTLTHSRYSHMCVSYDLAKILIFRTWQKKWYKCRVRASLWSYFFNLKKKSYDFFWGGSSLWMPLWHKSMVIKKIQYGYETD